MTRRQLSRVLVLAASAALLPLAVLSGPSPAIVLVFLVLAGLLGQGIIWPLWAPQGDRLLPVLVVFLAWAGATSVWSLSPEASLLRLAKLAWIVAAVWLLLRAEAATADWSPGPERQLRALALGTAVAIALVAAERGSEGWFFEVLHLRQPHPDPNIEATRIFKGIAALVVVCWCLLPYLLTRHGPIRSSIAVCALGLLVLWAGSLSAVLAIVMAALGFVLTWRFGRRFLTAFRIGAVSLVLFLPALGLFGPSLFVKAVSSADSAGLAVPGSALHRAHIYDFVLGSIWQRPLLGWGLDASSLLPGAEEIIPSLDRNLLPSHPHNGVLEVWVETGAVGAVLGASLLWLVLGRIASGFPDRAAAAAAVAAVVAYVVIGLLSFSLWATWWLSLAVLASFLFRAVNSDPRRVPRAEQSPPSVT